MSQVTATECRQLIEHACSLALGYGASGREDVRREYIEARDAALEAILPLIDPAGGEGKAAVKPLGYMSSRDVRKIRAFPAASSAVVSGIVVNFEGDDYLPVYLTLPPSSDSEKLIERLGDAVNSLDAAGAHQGAGAVRDAIRALDPPRSEAAARKDAGQDALASPLRPEGEAAIDGNEIWEFLFSELKGDVPEALTDDVLASLADHLAALSARPQPPQQPVAWPVGDARVVWYEPNEIPKPGKLIDCSIAVIDRAEVGDRFYSEKQVREIIALYAAPLAHPVATAGEERECTCHPDDNPPRPCQHKYALTDCRKAADEPRQFRAVWAVVEEYRRRHEGPGNPQAGACEVCQFIRELDAALRPPVIQPNAEEAGK